MILERFYDEHLAQASHLVGTIGAELFLSTEKARASIERITQLGVRELRVDSSTRPTAVDVRAPGFR